MSVANRIDHPRQLHPGAWWLWALGLAAAASRTTNPALLLLVLAVAGYVVSARRTDAPWARSFAFFLKVGLALLAIRVVLQALLGGGEGAVVLFTLPEVPLPGWAAGVHLGGAVTAEGVLRAVYEGLALATVLCCIGAANALASPRRLLRNVPGALYEAGVAVVVALTFAPQLVMDGARVRAARRLRGGPGGLRSLRRTALPVLEGALERSVELAASMDSRGYGRTAGMPTRHRRLTGALVLGGLGGVAVGVYGLLDATTPPALGLPALAVGAAAAVAGLWLGGRRVRRSHYRPDPWALPEWLVAAAGVVGAAAVVVTGAVDPAGLHLPSPLAVPPVPVLGTLGILLGLAPAWVAPPVPATGSRRPTSGPRHPARAAA